MNSLTRIMSYDKNENQEYNCGDCKLIQTIEYPSLSEEEIEHPIDFTV